MAIKRISDLSSILCVGTSNSSGAIQCLTIQKGIERDVLGDIPGSETEDNKNETARLKEALFEVSWPYGNTSSGYTNFESRSITYQTLSGYITHNILYETYTFAGNKTFTSSISIGENLTVNKNLTVKGSVQLGDSTDNNKGDTITIKGKQLSLSATTVNNEIGQVSSTLSGNLILNLTNANNANISVSNYLTSMTTRDVGRLDIRSNIVSIRTNISGPNGETGYFDVRGYDQDLSASHHVVMHTPSSFIRIGGYKELTATDFSDGDTVDISSQTIDLMYSKRLRICYYNKNEEDPAKRRIPVVTFGVNSNNEPTVTFNKSTKDNPINGFINHALWS